MALQASRMRANGIKKKQATSYFSSIVIIGSMVLAVALFGYFFLHTHITLGEYDKEIKFIRNKVESIAKSSLEIPIQSFKHYQNVSFAAIDHSKHLIDNYEIKNPVRKLP
jgi:hypothetical protein